MSEHSRSLLAGLKHEVASLGADLREMAALRWKLAELELRADFRSARQLALCGSVAALMVLAGLPVLVVCVAESLDGWLGVAAAGWLLIFGLTLLTGGAAAAVLAWRRFRRRFLGMQETLEELREDLVWLKEWAGKPADETEHTGRTDAE